MHGTLEIWKIVLGELLAGPLYNSFSWAGIFSYMYLVGFHEAELALSPFPYGLSQVWGPSQNLTLTLNEPPKVTLTLPPILTLTPTKPKPKMHNPPKSLGPLP